MHTRLYMPFLVALLLVCLLCGLPRLASAQIASFSVNPTSVTAGSVATGTVTLSAPAGAGGTTVTLVSSDSYAAGVPGSVIVPQGLTTANFPVATSYVSSTVTVTLTANYVHSYTTTLTVAFGPVLTLGPTDDSYVNTGSYASTNFGSSTGLLVKKDQNGITSSANRCAYLKFDLRQVPASPAILAATLRLNSEYNANGGTMTVKCYQVSDTSWTEGAITFNNAPGISSTFTSTGTYLTSQVMYITQGAVSFDLTSFVQAHIGQVVTLQLISEDITSQSALFYSKESASGGPMLTISLQPGVSSVSVAGPIPGGNVTTTGTVSLTQPAPSGGVTVTLGSSNNAAATVQSSVVVASGQTSASFTATSAATVSTTTSTTITASYNGTSANTSLTVLPNSTALPTLSSLSISPSTVAGGSSVTGTVTLSATPTTAVSVLVSCSNPQAASPASGGSFPAIVTIPANSGSSANFTINTSTVNHPTTISFTASYKSTTTPPASLTLTASNLRVTNITPTTIYLVWDTNTNCPYLLKRLNGGINGTVDFSASVPMGTYGYADTAAYTSGNTYCYQLFDNTNTMSPVLLSQEVIRPYLSNATDNQVVDSRLDLRRGQNVPLDHQFGSTTYRGGLFAGNAGDNSITGRSFLKIPLTALPDTGTFRVGNVNAYCTGATNSSGGVNGGSVTIGCQSVADSWTGSTLVWSAAPSLTASAATNGVTLNYTRSTSPGWVSWDLSDDIFKTLVGDEVLSAALAGTDESNNAGWAYFAKKEYMGGSYVPCATYAFETPVPVKILFSPSPLVGGGTVTVTVVVNGLGPGDSVPVTLNVGGTGLIQQPVLPSNPFWASGLTHSFQLQVDTVHGSCMSNGMGGYTATSGPGGQLQVTAVCNGVSVGATLIIQGYPPPSPCP